MPPRNFLDQRFTGGYPACLKMYTADSRRLKQGFVILSLPKLILLPVSGSREARKVVYDLENTGGIFHSRRPHHE